MNAAKITPTAGRLKDIRLLSGFDESELDELIGMGETASFEPHANIIIEGEPSWGLYLILDGYVGVFKNNKMTGDTHDVAQLQSGNFFGEMSLIDDNPRSASVKALTPVEVFSITKDAFQSWLKNSSDRKLKFYEGCVRHLVGRIRELDENYVTSQNQLWRSVLKAKKTKVARAA